MNKQELIKHIRALPYSKGPLKDTAEVNIGWLIRNIDQLDEPEKAKVPQCVADWYLLHYHDFNNSIVNLCIRQEDSIDNNDFLKWVSNTKDFIQILVNMHQFGYEVEERYYVRFKWIESSYSYLTFIKHLHAWTLADIKLDKKFRSEHTRKQLEDAEFGWVFDCPGIEIEEVK